MSSGATRRRCRRGYHPDRCPACGHGHKGQIREHNWLTCKRCGMIRKATTPITAEKAEKGT